MARASAVGSIYLYGLVHFYILYCRWPSLQLYPNSVVISIGDVNQNLINPILSINNTSKNDMPNIEFEGGEEIIYLRRLLDLYYSGELNKHIIFQEKASVSDTVISNKVQFSAEEKNSFFQRSFLKS